jgi:hypothetical protein
MGDAQDTFCVQTWLSRNPPATCSATTVSQPVQLGPGWTKRGEGRSFGDQSGMPPLSGACALCGAGAVAARPGDGRSKLEAAAQPLRPAPHPALQGCRHLAPRRCRSTSTPAASATSQRGPPTTAALRHSSAQRQRCVRTCLPAASACRLPTVPRPTGPHPAPHAPSQPLTPPPRPHCQPGPIASQAPLPARPAPSQADGRPRRRPTSAPLPPRCAGGRAAAGGDRPALLPQQPKQSLRHRARPGVQLAGGRLPACRRGYPVSGDCAWSRYMDRGPRRAGEVCLLGVLVRGAS